MAYNPGYYKVQSKRDRTPGREWVRRAIEKAYTQEEWIHKFKTELKFKDQFDALLSVQPKVVENKGETGITVRFELSGVREAKSIQPIQGKVVKELGCSTNTNGGYETGDG